MLYTLVLSSSDHLRILRVFRITLGHSNVGIIRVSSISDLPAVISSIDVAAIVGIIIFNIMVISTTVSSTSEFSTKVITSIGLTFIVIKYTDIENASSNFCATMYIFTYGIIYFTEIACF